MKRRPSRQEQFIKDWNIVESVLHSERRFLRLAEIIKIGKLSPAIAMSTVDKAYRRNKILKQFSIDERSIIIAVDEVVIPEIGYSLKLDNLLLGAGIQAAEFKNVEASYGLNRTDFLEDPDKKILSPRDPMPWEE